MGETYSWWVTNLKAQSKRFIILTVFDQTKIHAGCPRKSLWIGLEEKCLINSKIFFGGVFLYLYSHLLKKLELSLS
jgi:hypothetical protein